MKKLFLVLLFTVNCLGDDIEIILTNKPKTLTYSDFVVTNNIEVFGINTNYNKPFMLINNKIKSDIDILDFTPTNIIITFHNKPTIKQTTNGLWEITFESNFR